LLTNSRHIIKQATRIEYEAFRRTFETTVTLRIFQEWFINHANIFKAYNSC